MPAPALSHECNEANADRVDIAAKPSIFPASFAQQRLWFLHRLDPESPLYNVPMIARLRGELNIAALRQALNVMLLRHESLRTNFTALDGEPVQVIAPSAELELLTLDLTTLPEEAREAQAQQFLKTEGRLPFDLERDLLLRARLLRLCEKEHILFVNIHHVVSDGWSCSIFFRELAALYAACCKGEKADLPSLPIQYADFAVWQRKCLQGETLKKQVDYWKRQLESAPPVLELPLDHARPTVQTYRGATHPIAIPADLTEKLKELSQREGSTLFMTLLAAFKVLISRYTGQRDILIGSPIANRTRREIESLIGCFVNTIVLRSNLGADPGFRELLQQVRRVTLDAYAHQDLPFEKLVDELQPVRDRSYAPLFQMMFILQNTQKLPENFGDLTATFSEIGTSTTKFDFSLCLAEAAGGLEGYFEYATDLFEPTTVERVAQHFKTLLRSIIANPNEPISRLSLLTQPERHHLLVDLNDTQRTFPHSDSIQQFIEQQAELKPNAIALVWNKQRMTYRELNSRANQLAHYLGKFGAGPETLVGLCLERSIDLVVALLAILKSGSAYVPIDHQYPKERIRNILEDAEPALFLTQRKLLVDLPEQKAKVICLDKLDLSEESANNVESGVQPNNLAYVLFTSGSTGRPKGVAIEHRSVIAFIEWARTVFSEDDLNGVMFATSVCFDLSVFELFVTLSLGGKVILAENALELPKLPAANEIVLINVVPSATTELLRMNGIPRSVRILNSGGEALPQWLAEKVYKLSSVKKVYDLYGPTEDTVYSMIALRIVGGKGHIGKPIANTQAYILDEHQQPTPFGVPGELYLGGAGLARGYWRRPEITAEKFVPNPFSETPGSRLYRTGDLARYLPDGNIEYLGRFDHQVKIRGFRIELGEIETVLRKHPNIREAVVVARENKSGEKQLVAYLSSAKENAPVVAELRDHAAKHLPDYMIPSVFMFLPALPLTPNGKVDRKALPAPEPGKAEKSFVPPRDPLEQQLAKIWEEIFNNGPVGVRDNFFESGGHSLLAVRLFMQIEKITGKNLPLATLFEAPTIEQLAGILKQKGWEPPWLCVVPIKPNGSRAPFYCVHGVGGNILEYLDLAKYMDADQPFYGIQAIGLTGKHPWHCTVEEMAAHYVKEICEFQPRGPYYLGGASFGGIVAFEMAQQLRAKGETVALLALFDTHAPGYPKAAPKKSAWHNQLDHLSFRISLHWENLKATPDGERFAYVWSKIKKWSNGRVVRMKRWRDRTFRRVEEVFWPKEIRQTRQAGHIAYANYVGRKYPGSVVLFRATVQPKEIQPHPTLGWQDYIEGELEVRDTEGHHGSIIRDPRARILATQLKEFLPNNPEPEARPAAAP